MSIVTGIYGLMVQLNDGSTAGHLDSSTPQAEQNFTITGTPGAAQGSEIVLGTQANRACGWATLTWNGVQMIKALDHGTGLQWAIAMTDAGDPLEWFPPVIFAPTEQGSQADGGSADVCSSRNRYRGKNGANEAVRVGNAAHWLPPGRQSAPIAKNTTVLGDAPCKTVTTIGYLSPNIVKNVMTITIPTGGGWQSMIHALNAPWVMFGLSSVFAVFESVDLATGVATVVTPDTTTQGLDNPTDPYMISSTDTNYAFCMYMAAADVDVFVCHNAAGTVLSCSAQVQENYPSGTPAGDVVYTSYLIVGSRATVLDVLVNTLYATVG